MEGLPLARNTDGVQTRTEGKRVSTRTDAERSTDMLGIAHNFSDKYVEFRLWRFSNSR